MTVSDNGWSGYEWFRQVVWMVGEAARKPAAKAIGRDFQRSAEAFDRFLKNQNPLNPFVPTGWDMVGKIIDFAGPGEDSIVVDLGSGDGRLVIEAAKRYGSISMGIELNPQLVEIANRRANELRLENVAFLNTDVRVVSLEGVTHVVAYLTSRALKEIEHVLLTAPKDAVIVTHNYPIRGWSPVEVLETWSSSDGKLHRLYKYIPRLSAPAFKPARPLEARARRLDAVLNSLKARHL